MKKGIVYLIGAGPGDPKLITLKGKECLEKADTVVYDRLANERLLAHCREDAEYIYVGKLPDRHTLRQEEINKLLVEKGLEGKIVARLKGGDPFVFGRGGEEAEDLKDAGVPFEIVPGITSAISVPAYAGIPVTHRDFTSTFTVITGHEDPLKEETSIKWERLAQDPGTLIFLMGVGNLPKIVQKLVEKGKDKTTPVALIRWGTRPEQRVVEGSLENIVEVVEKAKFTSPAIIIVGKVVTLRDKLKWFEDKLFFGKRFLVTRSREQASALSEKIEKLGGEAWEYPTIAIEEPLDFSPMDESIEKISDFDWLVFTSVNGVKSFFNRLKELKKDIRVLGDVKICAIGPKTLELLEDKGLFVDFMPEKFQAEYIVDGMKDLVGKGDKVLLPRADIGRAMLVEGLEELGAEVTEVTAYRNVRGTRDNKALIEKLENKQIQVVTFTSSSTVSNFLELIEGYNKEELLEDVTIACIGPITADTAKENGLKVDILAEDYTIDGLVESMKEYFSK